MSRVLIFGADGLIGHYLAEELRKKHEVFGTLHGLAEGYVSTILPDIDYRYGVSARDTAAVERVLESVRPDWVINAIGHLKRSGAPDHLPSLEANTLFPHQLAAGCERLGVRLLHFSTDGVFSGSKGHYHEQDIPDSLDWYGRCKAMGEPVGSKVLVLRTCFIGLELARRTSLVEWFLSQRGDIPGYTGALWNGLTAAELARVIARVLNAASPPTGLWHLAASQVLSKFELLAALNARLGERNCRIVPNDRLLCNRSLDGTAFQKVLQYDPPSYDILLDELAEEILGSGRLP